MRSLPYATSAELSFARSRGVAGFFTLAGGAWLLIEALAGERTHGLAATFGGIGVLAGFGLIMAARGGMRRSVERAGWTLVAGPDWFLFRDADGQHEVPWETTGEISVDEETLEVVVSRSGHETPPTRITAVWGHLGAYDLAQWLNDARDAARDGTL